MDGIGELFSFSLPSPTFFHLTPSYRKLWNGSEKTRKMSNQQAETTLDMHRAQNSYLEDS